MNHLEDEEWDQSQLHSFSKIDMLFMTLADSYLTKSVGAFFD